MKIFLLLIILVPSTCFCGEGIFPHPIFTNKTQTELKEKYKVELKEIHEAQKDSIIVNDDVFWEIVPKSSTIKNATQLDSVKLQEASEVPQISELWVMNLKTKKRTKLLTAKYLLYDISPDGKKAVFGYTQNVKIVDRNTGKIETVFSAPKTDLDSEFIHHLDWSTDGSKYWFGLGDAESWGKIGYYSDEKIKWFKCANNNVDEAFNPNLGWVVKSNYPMIQDEFDDNIFQKSKLKINLKVQEVETGKSAIVASAILNRFKPRWISDTVLEYEIKKKKHTINVDELKLKLK